MISSSAQPWWYLGWIAAFAVVLAWLAPRMLRRGAWLFVVLEGALLVTLLVGDLGFGQLHSWPWNSMLLAGTITVAGLFLSVIAWTPARTAEQREAGIRLRLPGAMFLVVGVVIIWRTWS